VKAGETTTSVSLSLTPGSSVSGQVVDEDGDPLNSCVVQAHMAATPEQIRNAATTDDTGEYTLRGLPPGKFIFSAACNNPPFTPRPFSAGPDPPPSRGYPMQYYPLAADSKSAQPVVIAAGSDKPGVDFKMRPVPVTQVHVTINDPGSYLANQPNFSIQLVPVTDRTRMSGSRNLRRDAGVFDFEQVFPGSYYVFSFTPPNAEITAGGFQRIEVKDRPLDVVLDLKRGVEIPGTITVENSNPNNPVPLNQLQVQLETDLPASGARPQAEVKEDGSFTLKSVIGMHYSVEIFSPVAFVKAVWLGSTDVTHTPFDVVGPVEPLRIVLSTNMGSITGTAPPGELVFLVDEEIPLYRGYGQRALQADASGRFTLSDVAPGKYRISVGQMPLDTENAQEITVHEGETVTVEVKPPRDP
jgi:hypothetical protein